MNTVDTVVLTTSQIGDNQYHHMLTAVNIVVSNLSVAEHVGTQCKRNEVAFFDECHCDVIVPTKLLISGEVQTASLPVDTPLPSVTPASTLADLVLQLNLEHT